MLSKLQAFFLLAAFAVCRSEAENVAQNGMRDKATRLRGIAKHSNSIENINETNLLAQVALRKVTTQVDHLEEQTFREQAMDFWKKSIEAMGFVDTQNGYVGGVLFVYDTAVDTTYADEWEEFGGAGMVYLSWSGLALGALDNADKVTKILALIDDKDCKETVVREGVSLTISVLGQGSGLLSMIGADPAGGAVWGIVSAGIAQAESAVLDIFNETDCDRWLNKFDAKAKIEVTKSKEAKLPEKIELEKETSNEKKIIKKEDLIDFDEKKVKEVQAIVASEEWSYWNPSSWFGYDQKINGSSFYSIEKQNLSK